MDCIFCKIANNEADSFKIYENDLIKVFLDLNPNSNGHMLVIPKKHITDFTEMDSETIVAINDGVKEMQKLIMEKLNPDAIRLVVNYGFLQAVKHYHVHIIPINKKVEKIKPIEEVYEILTK